MPEVLLLWGSTTPVPKEHDSWVGKKIQTQKGKESTCGALWRSFIQVLTDVSCCGCKEFSLRHLLPAFPPLLSQGCYFGWGKLSGFKIMAGGHRQEHRIV